MAYDEALAARIRNYLAQRNDVSERKMFGGLCFLVSDHMCCGLTEGRLMVRVGPKAHEDALLQPYASPMDFTGRPMQGFVYVQTEGLTSAKSLKSWLDRGLAFVATLPPKTAAPPRRRPKKKAV